MKPKFNCALGMLIHAAERLESALNDPAYAPAMAERLGEGFAAAFAEKIAAVPQAKHQQVGQITKISDLTDEQEAAFDEVERLTAGVRRTAKLAFPGDTTRLREEFQVGIDNSKSLAAELQRASIILASVKKYATALQAKGWVARDTTALETALGLLTGKDEEQEQAKDDKLNLTAEKTAANALYLDCLAIQNAARLEYPAKVGGQPAHATERARFLLDEFPPRDRSEPDGGTQSAAIRRQPHKLAAPSPPSNYPAV